MPRRLMHPNLFTILAMIAVAFSWMNWDLNSLAAGETDEASETSADVSQVARLIEDMGSLKFQIREAATMRLMKIGDSAEAALLEATDDVDPERARRAYLALREIRKRKLVQLNERDLKRLKGKWTYESVFLSGKHEGAGGHLVISDTKLMIEKASGRDPYVGMSFTIDAAELPKHLDFVYKKATIRCLYRLEKDKLTLCYSSQSGGMRPKRIQCQDGDGLRLHVLTRSLGTAGSSEGDADPATKPPREESKLKQPMNEPNELTPVKPAVSDSAEPISMRPDSGKKTQKVGGLW